MQVQDARYLGRLEPGMDVCDVDGNKFGTISRVYRQELPPVGADTRSSDAQTTPRDVQSMPPHAQSMPPDAQTTPREELLEVKTGLFGLGKHMYVPFSAIQDVTSGCVFINRPKDRLEEQGWDVKPDYLDELS